MPRIPRARRADAGPARVAVVLALFLGVGVLAVQAATGAAPSRGPVFTVAASMPLEPGVSGRAGSDDVTVRIGRMSVLTDWQGVRQTALPVVVTNESERVRAFDLDFEAVGTTGAMVTRDSVYVAPLAPGDSAHVTVFEIVDRHLVSQLTSAVVRVGDALWYEF